MRTSGIVVMAVLFGAATATCAVADTVRRIKSGAPGMADAQFVYNPEDCRGVLPQYRIVKPPSHGVAEARTTKTTIPAGQPCAGQSFQGIMVVYMSMPGYRGDDELTVEYTWDTFTKPPRKTTSSKKVQITVE